MRATGGVAVAETPEAVAQGAPAEGGSGEAPERALAGARAADGPSWPTPSELAVPVSLANPRRLRLR